MNLSPPQLQTQPSFFHFRCSNHFLEEAIPGRSSVELSLPLLNPPSARHHPAILALCISFFFFFSRDLPPQSHKSTEDRCLLCLIKALPPGVIPQFEQEEKPSKGGMFWINPMKGPYYTLSFRFHQRETASQRS